MYVSYGERTYWTPVMRGKEQKLILKMNFHVFLHCRFTTLAKNLVLGVFWELISAEGHLDR